MIYRFPAVLKNLLKFHPVYRRKVTQKELGEAIHTSQPKVSLYVSGEVTPGVETMLLIAEYFHVSVDYLLTGREPDRKTPEENLIDTLIDTLLDVQDQASTILDRTEDIITKLEDQI